MESYISSLAKSNKGDKRSDVVAQEKINSCIKQLHNVIDSFEEDKTKQRFDTLIYNGKYSFDIKAPSKPKSDTEIYATVGNDNLWIGTLTTEGILNIESSDMRSSEEYSITSVGYIEKKENQVYNYSHENPPPERSEWVGKVIDYDETTEINGALYRKKGTKTYNYLRICDHSEWRNEAWYWDYTTTEYIDDEYTLDVDYTNADVYIFQRYLKK